MLDLPDFFYKIESSENGEINKYPNSEENSKKNVVVGFVYNEAHKEQLLEDLEDDVGFPFFLRLVN